VSRRIIIISCMILLPVFTGCYTKFASKRLTKRTWIKNHEHQYFKDTSWGSVWNEYYWSQSIKQESQSNISDSNYVIHESPIDETGSSRDYDDHTYHDSESCGESCIGGCIFTIIDAIFGGDDDNNGSSGNGSSSDNDEDDSDSNNRRGM